MIISHSHRFIFLHCRKTAGSSIAVSLARYLYDGDIIAGACDDCLAHNVSLPRLPSGCPAPLRFLRASHVRSIAGGLKHLVLGDATVLRQRCSLVSGSLYSWATSVGCGLNGAHTTAATVKQFVGDDVWNSYFKFAFVRNPWDRMVSFYHWRQRGHNHSITFADFVTAIASGDELEIARVNGALYSNWPIYAMGDDIAVDFIGRFESLYEDLRHVTERIGLDHDGWIPNAKGKIRPNREKYRNYYTTELRDAVASLFEREISHFGYEY